MLVKRYGITLEQLTSADLELVRIWRNSDLVRPYMKYQEIITPAMQNKWFNEMNKADNLYFMICVDGKKAGVVNLKDVDRHLKTAEAGIFIGEQNYFNTPVPVIATLIIMNLAFAHLDIIKIKALMNQLNKRVVKFNQSLGYKICPGNESDEFSYYSVSEKDYIESTKDIRVSLEKLGNSENSILITHAELEVLKLRQTNEELGFGIRLKG